MTKMGPNDARHIIWVLGESFFLLSSYYLILTISLLYLYELFTEYAKGRELECPEQPKQAHTTHDVSFGP